MARDVGRDVERPDQETRPEARSSKFDNRNVESRFNWKVINRDAGRRATTCVPSC
jgi:hypothetical protein